MRPSFIILPVALITLAGSGHLGAPARPAGSTPGASGATVVRLYSVPDSLSVFISEATEPNTLFDPSNLKGITPLSLSLQPGTYWVGYLLTDAPTGVHLATLQEVQPGLSLVMLFSDGTVKRLGKQIGTVDDIEFVDE